jgi:hypothetical protein
MRLPALSALAALLLLPSCVGSVRVDGSADSFGFASSAAAVHLDLVNDDVRFFVLSSRTGLCQNLEDAYALAEAAWDRWAGSGEDAVCDQLWDDLAEAWEPVTPGGTNFVFVELWSTDWQDLLGGLDEMTEPSEGSFDPDNGEVLMRTQYLGEDSPYTMIAEADSGCDTSDASDDALDSVVTWYANAGTVDLSQAENGGGWRVDFDVLIEDDDGDSGGDVEGGFDARPCELTLGVESGEFLSAPWAFQPWYAEF